MPAATSIARVLPLLSLFVAGPSLVSCSVFGRVLSQPPTLEVRSWQVETVWAEPVGSTLGRPSVFVDGTGRPRIALGDRAMYLGMSSIALARRDDAGWRVEFPSTPSAERVCGRAEAGGVSVISMGEVEGSLSAISWDGEHVGPAEPGPCPHTADGIRELAASDGVHRLARARDGQTLWHEAPAGKPCPPHDVTPGLEFGAVALAVGAHGGPQIAVFERAVDDAGGEAAGRLRHASCHDGAWVSSVVDTGVRVLDVGLAIDAAGTPHLGYLVASADGVRVMHATPAEGAPAPVEGGDARVVPALEACERLLAQPPAGRRVEDYQQGDAFRCAVLQRDRAATVHSLATATSRCNDGNPRACAVAGSLHHRLMADYSIVLEVPAGRGARYLGEWQGLELVGVTKDAEAAAALYGRACDGGEARACLHQAALVPADEAGRERATTACSADLAAGCALALASTGLRPDAELLAVTEPPLRRACEGGDAKACNNYGVARHVAGDAAAAREAIGRACDDGLRDACSNLGRLAKTP